MHAVDSMRKNILCSRNININGSIALVCLVDKQSTCVPGVRRLDRLQCLDHTITPELTDAFSSLSPSGVIPGILQSSTLLVPKSDLREKRSAGRSVTSITSIGALQLPAVVIAPYSMTGRMNCLYSFSNALEPEPQPRPAIHPQ